MRLIHCADIHLDSAFTGNFDRNDARVRKSELLDVFTKMVEKAAEEDVRGIIIAGDLFDTTSISQDTVKKVQDVIVRYSGLDFYYISGNHDSDGFLTLMDHIPDNLKLFEDGYGSYVLYDRMQMGKKVVITGVNEDQNKVFLDRLNEGCDPVLSKDDINIVIMHGMLRSAGGDDCIDVRELRGRNIDYLALGHIHSYMSGSIDDRGSYCYSGCLEGRGFDEAGEHGYVELDIDVESGLVSHTFVPLEGSNILSVDVDVSECDSMGDVINAIEARLDLEDVDENSMIEIILIGEVDERDDIITDQIERYYDRRYRKTRVKDNSVLRIDYKRFSRDYSLKGEFVRNVMEATDLSEEEKALTIKVGIAALESDGERFADWLR
ncbi:MAG: metallophosphoesterase [Lachnospiraceae bacterium]|nr:metallophosphoesterase [Lachnospiraceae bacterium]